MVFDYTPQGVCSQHMRIQLEDGVIADVKVVGGCNGNLQAVSALVTGLRAEEAIAKIRGIRCGGKPTSCPDQLARGLELALQKAQ